MSFSFLIGVLVGSFGTFGLQNYIKKYTKDITPAGKKQFKINECNDLFNLYPYFMNQIKNDIKNPESNMVREFFVVEKMAIMNSSTPRLRYDLSDDILPALNRLEQLNYIEKLPNDSLLYKMHDDFIYLLKSMD